MPDNAPSGAPERVIIDPARPDPETLAQAARVVQQGGVVAYPTEHFYALACDPANPAAVGRLFALKGRADDKPALLAIAHRDALSEWTCNISVGCERLVADWPDGLTLLFPAKKSVLPGIRSSQGAVAVRLLADSVAAALIDVCGTALTATSANRSGFPATGDPDRVAASLPGVDLLLDAGILPTGPLSTLLDVTASPWRILRQGGASAEALAAFGPVVGLD